MTLVKFHEPRRISFVAWPLHIFTQSNKPACSYLQITQLDHCRVLFFLGTYFLITGSRAWDNRHQYMEYYGAVPTSLGSEFNSLL